MKFDYEDSEVNIERAYEAITADIVFVGSGEQTRLEDQTITITTYSSTGIELSKTLTGLSVIVYENFENDFYKRIMLKSETFDSLVEEFLLEVEFEYMIPERNLLSLSVSGYYQGNRLIEQVDRHIF